MPSYSVPHSFPAVPDGFHAYLHADARVQSSDVCSSVYLALRGGKILRATASTHLLQQRSRLRGRHLATLRLQTDPTGRPKEPLFLTGLSPLKQPIDVTSRVWWSTAGLVAAHPDELIVFPSLQRATPLQICYRKHPDCTAEVVRGQSVRVEGVLSGGRLTATAIHVLPPLVVPRRWAQWRRWL
jgi:hypothetical protein